MMNINNRKEYIMEKIYTAKTEEAAKEQAVNEFAACGIEESDIEFEILERPVKKLFGMKGEFKVRAFAAEPVKAAAEEEAPAAFEEEEQAVTAPADGVNPLESEKVKNAVKYLTKVLEALGAEDFEIKTTLNGETVFLDIVGEKLGVVIGRRGETLDALQYLTILASNKAEESYCRISVDCNGYRAKRRETLEALAVKTANRVLKQGRRVTLEPMNPYERRIIHSKVAEIEGVFSNSIGEEPFRKVVISSNTKPVYNKSNDRRKGGHTVTPGKSYRQSTGFSTSFEREYKRAQAEPVEYSQETVDLEKDSSVLYGKIEL